MDRNLLEVIQNFCSNDTSESECVTEEFLNEVRHSTCNFKIGVMLRSCSVFKDDLQLATLFRSFLLMGIDVNKSGDIGERIVPTLIYTMHETSRTLDLTLSILIRDGFDYRTPGIYKQPENRCSTRAYKGTPLETAAYVSNKRTISMLFIGDLPVTQIQSILYWRYTYSIIVYKFTSLP